MKGSHFLGGQLQFHPLFQAYFILISGLFRAYFSKTSKILFFGGKVAISSLISSLFQPYFRLISGLFFQTIQNCIFWVESCNFIPYFKLISGLFRAYFSKTSKIVFFGGEVAISSLISVVSIYASDRGKKRQNYQESITSMMWAYFKLNRGLFLLHYYGLIMALLRPY